MSGGAYLTILSPYDPMLVQPEAPRHFIQLLDPDVYRNRDTQSVLVLSSISDGNVTVSSASCRGGSGRRKIWALSVSANAMQAARRTKPLVFGLAGVLLLAVAGSMLYGVKKKRDLETSALTSSADATARLLEAASGKADAARLQEHAQAVAGHLETLRREDLSRNKALAGAAELYLTDAQAILRNHAAAARARAAATASRRALSAHIANAGDRGSGWIQQALTLKTRAERDNFDYRTAQGALATLYHAHGESQAALRAVAPQVPLLEDTARQALRKQAQEAGQQAEAEIGSIRDMALPR